MGKGAASDGFTALLKPISLYSYGSLAAKGVPVGDHTFETEWSVSLSLLVEQLPLRFLSNTYDRQQVSSRASCLVLCWIRSILTSAMSLVEVASCTCAGL